MTGPILMTTLMSCSACSANMLRLEMMLMEMMYKIDEYVLFILIFMNVLHLILTTFVRNPKHTGDSST